MSVLTIEALKEQLHYNLETGVFNWKVPRRGRRLDREAGGVNNNCTYKTITLEGQQYLVHRLAWFYVHGEWPVGNLDHINRNPADNRIANLRQATVAQNAANSFGFGSSGYKGVYWSTKGQKWKSQITVNYKSIHLGLFDTPEEAHAAYCKVFRQQHGEFACTEHTKVPSDLVQWNPLTREASKEKAQ